MGILDAIFGSGGKKYTNQLGSLYDDIEAPSIEEQRLELDRLVQQGTITPEQAKAYLLEGNAYDDMELDSDGRQAQLAALASLSEIGNEGGLTASDRSKLGAIQNQEQTAARGSREAILQNARARGVGGSGLELMSQMQNQQDAATRQSTRDLDVAAMAQERALQALQSAGQLGGNINQQQFNQQQSIADSKNEIAKFNAANKQNVGLVNTGANNAAQAANLAEKQRIADSNTNTANQQQAHNKGLLQQGFSNDMQIAAGKSGALTQQAAQAEADKKAEKGFWGGLINTGAGVAAAFSDERVKEDVEPFDAGSFLDSLTGYKYKYKDPGMGEGKQVGVMAQDLEKEVPQMVEDTPRGKMVDYSPAKAGGPILAGLSNVHERLKRLEGR